MKIKPISDMRQLRSWLLLVLGIVFFSNSLDAYTNREKRPGRALPERRFGEQCDNAITQTDQAINNVRARLTTGGDVWWDSNNGRYIVPKVPPGVPEVSSIFAGAVWLGGVDPAGNLKLAAQTYGRSSGNFDFFPGPLSPTTGKTVQKTCAMWDRFFKVTGEEIRAHIRNWQAANAAGKALDPKNISRNIKGWPGRGNEYFFDVNQFELPNTTQGLAGFWDQDGDGLYNPVQGDFPVIEVRGCTDKPQFPDEMIFWIYNDAGNIHAETRADPIQMEVQVQAFSYATNDEINDMTFQRYKLINRAIESIDSTYFAMWVDPDLGCYTDDYVGCDTARSLAFVYNEDALDGQTGCSCPQGINTYCDKIPLMGIDYFRGPLNENGDELGMSSFTYYNNGGVGSPTPATTDPTTAKEYYNYLTGSWRDGSSFTYGDDAFQDGAKIKYAFTEAPNDSRGWSMCTAKLPYGDRRTIQASGPFRLDPGAVNELIVGVVWVPDQAYPCPDISKLLEADDIAQALFDNCFELTDGPDAPDVDFIELDQQIVAVLTNDSISSNNAYEGYAQRGLQIPRGAQDSVYRFEGYKLLQLSGPEVSASDFDNPDKARLIYQVDVKNGVSKIYNWKAADNPTGKEFLVPELKVDGGNKGIRHTFKITEDQFAAGDRRLINHKKYYFVTLAYAHNNYRAFDPKLILGQRRPYLEGRRNIGDGSNPFYTAIPHPTTDRSLNTVFGDGAVVSRIAGVGTGENFLDMADSVRQALLNENPLKGKITYRPGSAPIQVRIFNPLDVVDGDFQLRFFDRDMTNSQFDNPVYWELKNLSNPKSPVIRSEQSIANLNEQIVKQYGFTIAVGQTEEVGDKVDKTNGVIGYQEEYLRTGAKPWLFGIKSGYAPGNTTFDQEVFKFTATGDGEADVLLDPDKALTNIGPGYFIPYMIANWRNRGGTNLPYITPAWTDNSGASIVRGRLRLSDLNNVDIVMTSNKNLWSRCVVVEAASRFYSDQNLANEGNRRHLEIRAAASVSKEDANGDGLPDPETGNTQGFGWFPGYAIDVETGQRLNIFFAENSYYGGTQNPALNVGRDMMFNPTSTFSLGLSQGSLAPYITGGQHFVYVTKQAYDGCAAIGANLRPTPSPANKIRAIQEITWAGLLLPKAGFAFKSYKDGLIPDDVVVKLRVKNSFKVNPTSPASPQNNGYPLYTFAVKGKQASALDQVGINEELKSINVVPNPYYGFSDYEVSQFTTTIKITNLPAKCIITIYTLDGKFIRQYRRDEVGAQPKGNNRAIDLKQITPDLEWDLKNNKGIPIASGVYLIHVNAYELGTRTLKWLGVNRKFDPSGL
jgi:hypothetical protein